MAMIKIFNSEDRDFSTAGNIIIDSAKCSETKKKSLNGWFIEVELPIKYKEYIEKDKLCVVQTKSKLRPQAFRIGENIEYTNRKIKFTANHVMFDAKDYILVDVRPTEKDGINTLNYINERTDKTSPFNMFSNVQNTNTAYFIRKNLLEAWQTVEKRWNGVFDADNWDISFLQKVGHDNGESVIYGKNMQSMEIFEDWSGVCTRIYPVGYDGITLPEKFIDSDVQYEKPYSRVIDFQTNLEQEEQTEEKLIEELRENAQKYLEQNKYPKVSYTIVSNINNKMEIGDTIQVLHPLVTVMTEVIEYQYDITSKKIKSLTFGNYTRDVKAKFDNIKETINTLNQQLSKQDIVIKQQTDLINSLNKNGYVYIDDNEILILDALPKEKAKNVWRFGLGGIGFSSNGYEGPFETAITMDGQINAKFITTGTMSVNRIEGLSNTLNGLESSIELNKGNITMLVEQQDKTSKKLENDYYTKTETDSQITLESDNIKSEVKGIYSTKNELGETKKDLTALLELKLNKVDLISEINASADIIRMAAGKFIFTGSNFSLDENGKITATAGKIGGFNLSSSEFTGNLSGIYDYNLFDLMFVVGLSVEFFTIPYNLTNILDVNGDGQADMLDASAIQNIIQGTKTNSKNVSGTFKINSRDPKNCISIEKDGEVVVGLGVGGINTSMLLAETIICGYSSGTNINYCNLIIMNSRDGEISFITNGSNQKNTRISSNKISTQEISVRKC